MDFPCYITYLFILLLSTIFHILSIYYWIWPKFFHLWKTIGSATVLVQMISNISLANASPSAHSHLYRVSLHRCGTHGLSQPLSNTAVFTIDPNFPSEGTVYHTGPLQILTLKFESTMKVSCLGIIPASGPCNCGPGPGTTASGRNKTTLSCCWGGRENCMVIVASSPSFFSPDSSKKWRNLSIGELPLAILMLSVSTHMWRRESHPFMLLSLPVLFFNIYHFYFFIWLHQVLVVAHRIFHCDMQTLIWHVGSSSLKCGIEPRTPALGAWSLSHWTTREVPLPQF